MKNLLRNTAYASVILASLVVTAHQLARPADAFMASVQGVAAADGKYVLLNDGRIFYSTNLNWADLGAPFSPIPIPVSQVAYFLDEGGVLLVDTSGFGWTHTNGSWQRFGPLPGSGPIATEPTTWSDVKTRTGQ